MNSAIALEPIPVVEFSAACEPAPLPALIKPLKPRVWTPFTTLLAAAVGGQIGTVVAMIAVGVGVGFVMGAQGADSATIQARVQEIYEMPLPSLLLLLVPFQIGMALVMLFAAWRSKEPIRECFGLLPQTGRVLSGLKLATLAAFALSIAWAYVIVSNLFESESTTTTPLGSVITDCSWWAISLVSIISSVIPAVVEEALYRGYLQRRLLQRWSPAFSIGISTLLFALLHGDSLQHIVSVVPLGGITGLLAYRTNSIKPGMLVHALYNAGVVGIGAFERLLSPHLGEEIGLVVVMGVIGLPAVVSLLRSAKSKSAGEVRPVQTRDLRLTEAAGSSWLASSAV